MSSNTAIPPVPIRSEPIEAERQQETVQTTNMENQPNADQPELLLRLNHSTRDQLIISLIQLSTTLKSSKPIPEDAKQRTCKKIDNSVRLLIELSPFESTQSANAPDMFEDAISDQSIVELSRAERSKIINHLLDIRDVVLFGGLVIGERKSGLVTENKRIAYQLMDLTSRELNGEPDEDKNENNDEPPAKNQMVESKIADQNEEVRELKVVTEIQAGQVASLEAQVASLEAQVASLEARMDEQISELKRKTEEVDTNPMKKQISELKQEIQEININWAKALFKFELADVSKFFEVIGNHKVSTRFWCRGVQWLISAECAEDANQSKQLGVYLRCVNDDLAKWSIKTEFQLILFNRLPESQNYVGKCAWTFEKKQGYGKPEFISHSELIDEKNGYIKDDKILLGVELKAGQVNRKW